MPVALCGIILSNNIVNNNQTKEMNKTCIPSLQQVKSLVSTKLFERYDRLLLQRSLDMMIDVVYCPRTACMCPVLVDEKESMGSCPLCRYVFCTFCKMVYHGISPCQIAAGEPRTFLPHYSIE